MAEQVRGGERARRSPEKRVGESPVLVLVRHDTVLAVIVLERSCSVSGELPVDEEEDEEDDADDGESHGSGEDRNQDSVLLVAMVVVVVLVRELRWRNLRR